MEKYQFKIGELIITNPEGWKDFEIRIKRDDDIAGLLVTSTNRFTFKGDGYDELHSKFLANYNDKATVTIDILGADNTYTEKYKGVVVLTDVKFNLEKRFAEATVEDASFQGAIQSNKNVKSFIDAGLTKNGEAVAVPTIFLIDFFNSSGNYNPVSNRNAYLLKDALAFLVRFMTDDEVKGVQSSYLDDTTNFEGSLPYITTGLAVRLANQEAPNVSFSECIIFLQRTHDLTFDFVTDSNGDPVMRIEDRAFFFQDTISDTMRDLTDLSVKVDAERVYSHLEVGNNTTSGTGNCSTTVRWFTFQKEDYALRGKGNIDKLLDLTTDFITDSNVIEDAVNNNNDSFDDNTIIVLGNVAGTQASKFNSADYCSNNAIYNLGFTNDNVIDRQIESIPNSVTKYLTAATTPSGASTIGATITGFFGIPPIPPLLPFVLTLDPFNFTNEQYDLGNRYDTSNPLNTFYDVPFAGDFSFEANVQAGIAITSVHTLAEYFISTNFSIEIRRFDSTFTTLKESVSSGIINISGGNTNWPLFDLRIRDRSVQTTMSCDTGDRVNVLIRMELLAGPTFEVEDLQYTIVSDPNLTNFKCLGAAEDAGTFKVFDPNSFKARLYTYEKNVSLTRSDNLRANTRNALIINELSDTTLDKKVWIEEMVNNIETGTTTFIMIN